MTHSGGKPHQVGDRGQRYEISVIADDQGGKRIVVAWTNDKASADRMAVSFALRPSWRHGQVRDRQEKAGQ